MRLTALLLMLPLVASASQPMLVATSAGKMWRCNQDTVNSCYVFNTAPTSMNTVLTANGYIYTGLGNGVMWRCDSNNANACSTFNALTSAINTLISANGYIYAGLNNGEMWRCSPDAFNACAKINTLPSSIKHLLRTNGYVYAGLENGEMWRCSPDAFNACIKFNTLGDRITGLAATGGHVYATASKDNNYTRTRDYSGYLWRCDPNNANGCAMVSLPLPYEPDHSTGAPPLGGARSLAVAPDGALYIGDVMSGVVYRCPKDTSSPCSVFWNFDLYPWGDSAPSIKALTISNGYLYIGFSDVFGYEIGTSNRCPLSNPNACEIFSTGDSSGVNQMATPYDALSLKPVYAGEDKACTWQNSYRSQSCPLYVQYLDRDSRLPLMLTIKNGKVYNSQGVLFDTTYADSSAVSNGGNAAIFVMDTSGNLYASNTHPTTLFRHSSFFAGLPVAAAGEMKVVNGVITEMNNCAAPYQSNVDMTAQLLLSLDSQGYSVRPSYTSTCVPSTP